MDVTDFTGGTPLHVAATNGEQDAMQVLLEAGAAVNATALHCAGERLGFTPLHFAALTGHQDAVQVLLDAGAALHATTSDGTTPLRCAASRGYESVAQMLRQATLHHGD